MRRINATGMPARALACTVLLKVPMTRNILTPEQRRKLVEAPITVNIFGGRPWSGSTISSRVPVEGRRVPSINYSYQEEKWSSIIVDN